MKTLIVLLFLSALTGDPVLINGSMAGGGQPEIGKKVPGFTAIDHTGSEWNLADHLQGNYLVVYFYPAAFTGGCTAQACSYRDNMDRLRELNTKVVGISGDKTSGLASFREHHNLNFTLLSDPEGEIAGIFGVPVRDGGTIKKKVEGNFLNLTRTVTTSRHTFVIGPEGKLLYRDSQVNPSRDPGNIANFISEHAEK